MLRLACREHLWTECWNLPWLSELPTARELCGGQPQLASRCFFAQPQWSWGVCKKYEHSQCLNWNGLLTSLRILSLTMISDTVYLLWGRGGLIRGHTLKLGINLDRLLFILRPNLGMKTWSICSYRPVLYVHDTGFYSTCQQLTCRQCPDLVQTGAYIDPYDNYEDTPLILAAREGFFEVVSILLHSGKLQDRIQARKCEKTVKVSKKIKLLANT